MYSLHHGRNSFEPHAGIYRGPGQVAQFTGGRAFVLHEHEVPQFDVPITVLIGRTRRSPENSFTMVVEDLRARPAGTNITHRPEITGFTEPGKPTGIHTHLVQPERRRLIIVFVDRNPELFRRDFQFISQKLPGVLDGLGLKIIAETEIAEHFKKGMMPRGISDVFEVIVLASGPDTPLTGHGTTVIPAFVPKEGILELDHAGVGKQQGRVVPGNQLARGYTLVAALAEELEKGSADFHTGHFFHQIRFLTMPIPTKFDCNRVIFPRAFYTPPRYTDPDGHRYRDQRTVYKNDSACFIQGSAKPRKSRWMTIPGSQVPTCIPSVSPAAIQARICSAVNPRWTR